MPASDQYESVIQRHRGTIITAMATAGGIVGMSLLLVSILAVREAVIMGDWVKVAASTGAVLLSLTGLYLMLSAVTETTRGDANAQ